MEYADIPHVFSLEAARNYEDFYRTPYGERMDAVEKEAVQELLSIVPLQKRGALLEVGCGTGHWTEFFVNEGFRVTATDPSSGMLSVAKGKSLPGTTFISAPAEQLPFPDDSFPVVAAITVFEFVEDTEKAVSEIGRVLRKEGWFLGGFLNAGSEIGRQKNSDPILRHARLFTLPEIEQLLAPLGKMTVRSCVHLSPKMEILDGTHPAVDLPPAFYAVRIQKQ
ncbi:MAG: class I SAM-dependent methyltransferase [Spirochaetales bacterium]